MFKISKRAFVGAFDLARPWHPKNWLPCLLCGQNKAMLYQCCRQCWQDLPWHGQTFVRHDVNCFAALYYDFPINRVLQGFKDHAQFEYGDFLLGCLLQMPRPRIQAIVPMPLSNEKLIQRGYNQTLLLARALARYWRVPVWQPFERSDGHSQRGLSRQERLRNLEGVLQPNHAASTQYRHVLMLDDVITTGASLAALQHQLLQIGCHDVQALCVCDAMRRSHTE